MANTISLLSIPPLVEIEPRSHGELLATHSIGQAKGDPP
jgi:hypothetical protein